MLLIASAVEMSIFHFNLLVYMSNPFGFEHLVVMIVMVPNESFIMFQTLYSCAFL